MTAVPAQGGIGQDPCEAAHELLDLGLPITLCQPNKKTPIAKGWPEKTWTHDEIDAEFQARCDLNIGVVLGPRSGLIDIEIDGLDGDAALLELFDGDVPVTPLWRSARGPHRLFKWHEDLERVGKSVITLGSLEIRLGADGKGTQSLVPPSITDGWGRRWGVTLEECNAAELPTTVLEKILAAGGVRSGDDGAREGVRHSIDGVSGEEVGHSNGCDIGNVGHSIAVSHAVSHSAVSHTPPPLFDAVSHFHRDAVSHSLKHASTSNNTNQFSKSVQRAIKRAIDNTLPGAEGFRNKLLLQLARQLKGIPELTEAQPNELLPIVQEWHRLALPAIATKDFETTWDEFVVAWGNVKYPAGEGPLDAIYQAALLRMPAITQEYKVQGVRNLIALCRELQQQKGKQPFFLACRPAAAVLNTGRTSINRWLWKLIHSGVLELVTEGSRGRAAEYRYLGD